MLKIYLTSLGCKLNQAEIESLARHIESSGHQVVVDPHQADWAIINTCTVTHVAARKSRRLIRHLRRVNAGLRLAVIGCYAEMSPEEIRGIEGVDLVIPNADKETTMEQILAVAPAEEPRPAAQLCSPAHRLSSGRTRAFVKVQDGCDNRCAYCIVTIARGPSQSYPPQQVLDEIARRLAEGYQEIVLTGVNIGAYGRDKGEAALLPGSAGWSLSRLVRTILQETAVPRLRLSSIEPWDVSPDLLALWEDRRLCRHLHLPLQSGCDDTLRRMRRHYTTEQFETLVEGIRGQIPEVSITTDIIVGFPGETEAEFERSLAFIERVAFSRIHAFKYSRRPGTPAADMPDQVSPQIAQARSERVIALGHRLARGFHERFLGTEMPVLCEASHEGQGVPLWNGLTDNYIRVTVPSGQDLANRFATVRCRAADEKGLEGELVRLD